MQSFVAQANAPAKINLSLKIVGKTTNNYHLIESYVTKLQLSDTLGILYTKNLSYSDNIIKTYLNPKYPCPTLINPDICLTVENQRFYASRPNITTKAVAVLRDYILTNKISHNEMDDVTIFITKNIPTAAGLGGGSSNAATVLQLVCRLWEAPLTDQQLLEVAAQLGADVYLFLKSAKSFLMTGIGNILTEYQIDDQFHLVLVNPKKELSTATVYQLATTNLIIENNASFKFPPSIIEVLSIPNDLQPAAIALCPEIGQVLKALEQQSGCISAKLTGSGATCFAIYDTAKNALNAKVEVEKHNPEWWCYQELVQ